MLVTHASSSKSASLDGHETMQRSKSTSTRIYIYKELKKNHSYFFYGVEMAKPQFSVLEWSEFELSWDIREHILSIFSKMGPSVEEMSNKQIVDAAFDLGFDYDRTFVRDAKGFLKACVKVMETTDKFKNVHPKDKCNADNDDEIGISCYNKFCELKH